MMVRAALVVDEADAHRVGLVDQRASFSVKRSAQYAPRHGVALASAGRASRRTRPSASRRPPSGQSRIDIQQAFGRARVRPLLRPVASTPCCWFCGISRSSGTASGAGRASRGSRPRRRSHLDRLAHDVSMSTSATVAGPRRARDQPPRDGVGARRLRPRSASSPPAGLSAPQRLKACQAPFEAWQPAHQKSSPPAPSWTRFGRASTRVDVGPLGVGAWCRAASRHARAPMPSHIRALRRCPRSRGAPRSMTLTARSRIRRRSSCRAGALRAPPSARARDRASLSSCARHTHTPTHPPRAGARA